MSGFPALIQAYRSSVFLKGLLFPPGRLGSTVLLASSSASDGRFADWARILAASSGVVEVTLIWFMRLDKRTRSGPCGRGSRFALISSHTSLAVLLPVVAVVSVVPVVSVLALPTISVVSTTSGSISRVSASALAASTTASASGIPNPNLSISQSPRPSSIFLFSVRESCAYKSATFMKSLISFMLLRL